MQTSFRYRVIAEEATCQVVVLILKGGGDYCGIGLVEMVWKAVAVILNRRVAASITYQGSLHGFREVFITGTTTLEFKLIQQVNAMREGFVHVVLLDLHKVYDALDSFRCLDILEGYGVGPRSLRLLRMYWEIMQMVAR